MDRRTKCAQGAGHGQPTSGPLAPVIVPASTFSFDDLSGVDAYYETGKGFVYSRYGNPTVRQAERLIADLEGAEDAVLFGSGMAAISTLMTTLAGSGDRIAAQRELYGGTADLLERVLPRMGVHVEWFGRDELARLDAGRLAGCKLLFLETPINPTLRLIDLAEVARVARQAGVPVAVDSTFATPILQAPIELGADLVVHSASKYLGGHSDLIAGVVAGSCEQVRALERGRRSFGGILDPFAAFLLLRGLRTLAVRMDAHCRGALEVARGLQVHPGIAGVLYPGLASHVDHALACRQMRGAGGMVSLLVHGGADAARRLHDRVRLFRRAGSLGGVESLLSIPATMSHRSVAGADRERIGIPDNLVRLSVGLELPSDLLADLDQALSP